MSVKKLTKKQQELRKNLLARVHLAPIYTDYFAHFRGEYQKMLDGAFGKSSAADLSINQLSILVKFLYSKTTKETNDAKYQPMRAIPSNKYSNVHSNKQVNANNIATLPNTNAIPKNATQLVEHITPAQIKYINRLWQQKARTPTPQALRAFIEKNFKKVVLSLNALTKKEASGLINALNRM